ncbi:MAG: glycoside hydrolase family 5 [Fibrobacteres bacterium]|nr:glycoside hydrolase family 5 [Fibrobacterota bacterium]
MKKFALGAAASLGLLGCLDAPVENQVRMETRAAYSAAGTPSSLCLGNTLLSPIGATASSVENGGLGAVLAIDGNPATRWSSAWSDPQWIRLDLGATRYINSIFLSWEKASSLRYDIQVSMDGINWKGFRSINYGFPGPGDIDIPALNAWGRYVRIHSYERTTTYGVSLFEIRVYGDPNGSCTVPASVHIDAAHSGKSLDVKDWSLADGGRIHQWAFVGGNNQRWIMTDYLRDNHWEIKSVHSGKCLDVSGNSTADGAAIHQWACNSAPNQRFTLKPAGGNKYLMVAAHSGKCLDVDAWSQADGAAVIQWPCHGGANQQWSFTDPQDAKTDPRNCGRIGHDCLGGACSDGVCQAATVASDFQCLVGMAADEGGIWAGDNQNLYRYDINGYNKTRLLGGYFSDLIRGGNQLFWNGNSSVSRLNDGQTAATGLYSAGLGMLQLNGSALIGYDYAKTGFVAVDRNLAGPGASTLIYNTGAQSPFMSAVTGTHLYYAYGDQAGTVLNQIERSTGRKTVISNTGDAFFDLTAFGETVYWSYRDASGNSGIRRLSSAPGSTVQEAVNPVSGNQSIGNPVVDASGIYYPYGNGTNTTYVRTPHGNPSERILVTNGYSWPYQSRGVQTTSNSIIWMQSCSRGGPGMIFRLAKP